MPELTIYEVSTCSTCRKLAVLLAARGVEYEGVEYHETGLDEATIRALLARPAERVLELLDR